ncbi:MAG: hypothetical protein CSA11_03890 [Chloroflexi bacterium]|nr:MAG: hypothetical protein CSA11_03890 [Chloroflexota bacterium]
MRNLKELEDWLVQYQIDTSSWGQGRFKSVDCLWAEIVSGESTLWDNPPRRRVQVAQVMIRRGDLILVEAEQVMRNGSRRFREHPPTEKFKAGESPLAAARRCLQEELGVQPEAICFLEQCGAPQLKRQEAYSYPGLLTEYVMFSFDAEVAGLPEGLFYQENQASADDPVRQHGWAWRPAQNL